MRRLLLIIALLVVVPIIEITALIAVGQVIGVGWTLLLMLATSALGGWLLRHQGMRAWRTFQSDLSEGRPPGNAATEGLLVLTGGMFMLVPGFVSDIIGVLLIAPPTRRIARSVLLRVLAHRISPQAATALFGPRRVRARSGQTWQQSKPASTADTTDVTTNGRRRAIDSEPIEGEIIDP